MPFRAKIAVPFWGGKPVNFLISSSSKRGENTRRGGRVDPLPQSVGNAGRGCVARSTAAGYMAAVWFALGVRLGAAAAAAYGRRLVCCVPAI